MKKILFRKLLLDCSIFFLITLISASLMIWVFQAVNFLDILKEEGARHGANVLMPPKTVMDNGYMAQDCWRKDPVHGNVKYGNAIIHMVLNRAFGHAGVNKHD